jgi:hypothetical protein
MLNNLLWKFSIFGGQKVVTMHLVVAEILSR